MEYQPKKFITRFFEFTLTFAAGCLLLRFGVFLLAESWKPLLVIALLAAAAVTAVRVYKHRRDVRW